jgi:hypothetical protein
MHTAQMIALLPGCSLISPWFLVDVYFLSIFLIVNNFSYAITETDALENVKHNSCHLGQA